MRFVIFSTNRCNLSCHYCAVAVNKFHASSLSPEQVCRAIDHFLVKYPGREHKVIFLGGEPFIYFDELRRVIRHLQRRRPGGVPGVDLFTNGTLMSQDKVSWLEDNGVDLYLSLDGRRETNDAHRLFHRREGDSVFDRVMENLARVDWRLKRVNMVLHQQTSKGLIGNIHFFHKLGFQEINFQPDIYEVWTPAQLAGLSRLLREFAYYYGEAFKSGRRVFLVPILYFVLERLVKRGTESRWWEEPEDVMLSRDGRFYPCSTASTFEPAAVKRYRIGDLKRGIQWAKWRSFKARVKSYIVDHGLVYSDFYHTPEEMFLYGEASPLGVDAVFQNEIKVSEVLRTEFVRLALRLRDDPRFSKLYVKKDYTAPQLEEWVGAALPARPG